MTQDPMTSKKENTAPAQPSVPAAKEKESVKELLPLSPEHEALVSGMYDRLVKTVRTYNPGADFAHIRSAYEFAKQQHGDQRRKQTAKRHILRMFPAPRNCFFSHLFSSIMHDAFFHKQFLSWHAATVPTDFRCPCMFPFAQNESSSITPPGIYGSSAQAQDSPSVLQSDKRVLHPPAT